MSHLRVSAGSAWSPLIPSGRAHMIFSLEPIEVLRVMAAFGNPEVAVICNNRPVNPIGVICGDYGYRGGPAGQPHPEQHHPDRGPGPRQAIAAANPVNSEITVRSD